MCELLRWPVSHREWGRGGVWTCGVWMQGQEVSPGGGAASLGCAQTHEEAGHRPWTPGACQPSHPSTLTGAPYLLLGGLGCAAVGAAGLPHHTAKVLRKQGASHLPSQDPHSARGTGRCQRGMAKGLPLTPEAPALRAPSHACQYFSVVSDAHR